MGGGKEATDPRIMTESSLNAEQEALKNKLSAILGEGLDTGVTPFTGEGVAGFSADQQAAFDKIRNISNTDPALANQLNAFYQNALKGTPTTVDSDATRAMFQRSIADPAMKRFQRDIVPQLREQSIGITGTGFGTDVLDRTYKGGRDLSEYLAGRESELLYADEQARRGFSESAKARALQAAQLGGAYSIADRARQAQESTQLFAMGQVQQQLAQAGLNWDYKQFLRNQPENSPYISQAMQFLGIPMVTQMGVQGQTGSNPLLDALMDASTSALGEATGRVTSGAIGALPGFGKGGVFAG